MKKLIWIPLCLFFSVVLYSQDEDAFFIKKIYEHNLTNSSCYQWLDYLSTNIGGRLAGSPEAMASVLYTQQVLDTLQLDDVRLQECTVPHWDRGEKEIVKIVNSKIIGTEELDALALGNSIGTGPNGITAEVIEVQSIEEIEDLGDEVKGKIVFFNRPMDPKQIRTFNAYGGAVDQRVYGASEAGRHGAVAALVRSMTQNIDDVPHTGVQVYKEGVPKIPAISISTKDAELLSRVLKQAPTSVYMRNTSRMLSDKKSYNVIGEIKGSTHPDEIILVGGHLDSWDVGGGAHDDGSGCVQAMEVLNTLKRLGYQPKRTIRCVLFMNEENGLGGALEYAKISNENNEYHLAAIESDAGGFTPRGFGCSGNDETFIEMYGNLTKFLPLLEPYGLTLKTGGGGADISPLKSQKGLLIGLMPDSQRYFDYHHTADDTIDAVNARELQLGAAAMTALVYLIDQKGL